MAGDPVADLLGEVQPGAVALQGLDDPQRVLVVAEAHPEALPQAVVEHLLADVAEGRVTEVVPEPDRLGQVLVEPQRPGYGARDRGHLEGVGEARPVVVSSRRDEHLGLVREAAEGLAVDDPVAVALEGRPQRAVLLEMGPPGGVGARGQGREQVLLPLAHARGELLCDGALLAGRAHLPILPPAPARRADQLSRSQSLRPVSRLDQWPQSLIVASSL